MAAGNCSDPEQRFLAMSRYFLAYAPLKNASCDVNLKSAGKAYFVIEKQIESEDGHVAWRGDAFIHDVQELLDTVRGA